MSILLQRHVYELAAAFGVAVIEHDDDPTLARAVSGEDLAKAGGPNQNTIAFGRIVDRTSYAVALHELGHLCAPDGYLGREKGVGVRRVALTIHEEEAAWAWAQHYALEWTEEMEAVKQLALSTYTTSPRRRPAPKPAPPPAPPFTPIDWSKYGGRR
jgi:hypothetical protein